MKKSLEFKINEFIEAYRVIRDIYYTDTVKDFENYKHFFIFKRSNEIKEVFEEYFIKSSIEDKLDIYSCKY